MHLIEKWLFRNGRPLDSARYKYLFLEGSAQDVLEILETYQNHDGGFGHGLEPDCWNPHSSPIQTMMAFEIIDELGLHSYHSMIQRIISYLMNVAPKKDDMFYTTIPTNNLYPHAQWWSYNEEDSIWGYNPTIAIVAFIYKHSLPSTNAYVFAHRVIEKAINDFIKFPSKEMHELKQFLDMANSIKYDNDFTNFKDFEKVLIDTIGNIIEKDSNKWFTEYSPRPLQFFDNPDNIGFNEYQDLIMKEVEMLINKRNKDGIWDITWTWNNYENEFVIAKQRWQSILIINNLKILKNFYIKKKAE